MDADKLIEEFLTDHVNAIVIDHPQATIIIDAWHKDNHSFGPQNKWQYLIWPADHPLYGPAAKTWYFEHEVLSYTYLIDKYWDKNWYNKNVEPNGGEAA